MFQPLVIRTFMLPCHLRSGLADTTIRSSYNLSMIIIEMKIMPDAAHALHTNAVNSHASVTGARDSFIMYDRTTGTMVPEPVRVGQVACE